MLKCVDRERLRHEVNFMLDRYIQESRTIRVNLT